MRFPTLKLTARSLFLTALMILGPFLSLPAGAQTLTIRLLNGKTGKPIANKNVTVTWDFFNSTFVTIDKHGFGTVALPKDQTHFSLDSPTTLKERYRPAYMNCNEPKLNEVEVKQVVSTGYVPHNLCGHHVVQPKPGQIVVWAKPMPWWLKLNI